MSDPVSSQLVRGTARRWRPWGSRRWPASFIGQSVSARSATVSSGWRAVSRDSKAPMSSTERSQAARSRLCGPVSEAQSRISRIWLMLLASWGALLCGTAAQYETDTGQPESDRATSQR